MADLFPLVAGPLQLDGPHQEVGADVAGLEQRHVKLAVLAHTAAQWLMCAFLFCALHMYLYLCGKERE